MAEFQRESKAFSQVLDFTRGSTGTYFDSAGVLKTAAVDEPRFTHDPDTLESRGLLIEEQRPNLFLQSEDFSDAVWGLVGATVSSDAEIAPDATFSMDKIVEDSSDGFHYTGQTISITAGQTYVLSVVVKPDERTKLSLQQGGANYNFNLFQFDLSDGSIDSQGDPRNFIKRLTDGRWLCVAITEAGATGAGVNRIELRDDAGARQYVGDGVSGAFVWGAQLEPGSTPSSYIKTEDSQVIRSADNCSRTLGSEFTQDEGTVLVEFRSLAEQAEPFDDYVVQIDDGSISNRRIIRMTNDDVRFIHVNGGSTSEAFSLSPGVPSNVFKKAALSYVNGVNFIGAVDGITLNQSDTASAPSFSRMLVGDSGSNQQLNGIIKYIKHYPFAMTETELQGLTV